MIKLIEPIDTSPILTSYYNIEESLSWTDYDHKGRQTGLQYKEGQDPWSSAVGKSQGAELDYIHVNPFFKDTIFETLINKYNLRRTRLMWVGPFACYSIHRDQTPRIHIPLITNPSCLFVFRSQAPIYLSAGSVYWVDTRHSHTFINCSEQHRLHLVGVVES